MLEVRLGIWIQSCDRLVFLLDNYSQTLLSNLQRFQELGDRSGAGIIRSSCIDCLAHLAALCEALGQIEPTRTQLDALCDSSLERLCELTKDVRTEEYTRLDLLLGVRVCCNGQANAADDKRCSGILENGARSL